MTRQMTYLKATGQTKRLCKHHGRFDCSCACGNGQPPKDYAKIDHAICRVLEIYATPEKPMPPRQIQRMIKHLGVERPYIYRDLQRLENKGRVARLSCKSGYILC